MVMEQLLKAIDARDAAAFADLVADECDFVAPGATLHGPHEAWAWMTAFLDAFPDITHTITSSVESGNREAVELAIAGTHTAPLVSPQGAIPATGKPMTIAACDMVTTGDDGRVTSYHVYFDQMDFMAQLGLTGA